MNWDAIGAVAELLGAVGVIASLLYLARQMRSTASLARRAAGEAVLAKITTTYERASTHPQLDDVFIRGTQDLASLTQQGLGSPV